MKSRLLARSRLETMGAAVRSGLDGQGKPSYATAVDICGRVIRKDEEIVDATGSTIRTSLTVWLPCGTSPMPTYEDRLTYDGSNYIVAERSEPKDTRARTHHVRLRCRDE